MTISASPLTNFAERTRVLKYSLVLVWDLRLSPKNSDLGPLEPDYAPINVPGSSFSTGWHLLGTGVKIRSLGSHFHSFGVAL
jgi:hypothetical protein